MTLTRINIDKQDDDYIVSVSLAHGADIKNKAFEIDDEIYPIDDNDEISFTLKDIMFNDPYVLGAKTVYSEELINRYLSKVIHCKVFYDWVDNGSIKFTGKMKNIYHRAIIDLTEAKDPVN